MNNSYITIIKEKRTVLSRKRVPLNQNECTADFGIGVPFEQNLHACLVARKNMGLGTVVYALVSGYFIDFYSWILIDIHLAEQDMLIRILAFAIGQCCLSLGLALLIQLNLGMNALDAVLYKIQNHTNFSYTIMRTGCDISYVVIGTVLGGTFGAGTICSVLVTGTMVTMITNIIGRIQKYEYKWRYETN
ncbi:YczE/YyaS/YitT family protein [Blautia wexlerae]|uniref:YczE/YyaS/YitT family protein n=1 Tax=Blautia wexlerae TaxID=418240 RepID=UPI001A9B06DD|nr:hypothetical protein [Blautia wexlerae]